MRGILFAALSLLLLAGPARGKTLIVNVSGHTVGKDGKWQTFGKLLIGDDGRVLSLLGEKAKEPKLEEGDFRLDAEGKALLPGFVDSRLSLMALGLSLADVDLRETRSLAEAQQLLGKEAAKHQPAQESWIIGHGWDEGRWQSRTLPTKEALDSVTGGRPAWLRRAGGHAGLANSAALGRAKVTAATKAPAGGQILLGADGQPTGILLGTAMALVEKVLPPPSAGAREEALAAALRLLPRLGVTSVSDMGTTAADWALYRAFADDGRLPLRINAYAAGMGAMETLSPLRPTRLLYEGKLRLQGIEVVVDPGMVNEKNGAKLKNLVSRANFLGYQAAVRAVGQPANAAMLDAYHEIVPGYGEKFRNLGEHLQLTPGEAAAFAKLKLVASVAPLHEAADQTLAAKGADFAFLGVPCPLSCLQAQGVRISLGSGAPFSPVSPFVVLGAALQEMPSLSLADALRGYTWDAAFAAHREKDTGSLEKGHYADFIMLDRDPFTATREELPDIRVIETWVGGGRVFVAGQETRKR